MNSELTFKSQYDGCSRRGEVESFDRNDDGMMDAAWGAGKSFHQTPLEGAPPRETGMGARGRGVEISSWTEERAEAKRSDGKGRPDAS